MPIKRTLLHIRPARLIVTLGLSLAVITFVALIFLRRYVVNPVLSLGSGEIEYLYVPTGADFDDVLMLLDSKGFLADREAFVSMAVLMGYPSAVKPGRYELSSGLTARSLVAMLRAGAQKPVNVTFNNIRMLQNLAGVLSRHLEADSAELLAAMRDSLTLSAWGFDRQTAPAIYLPDTYNLWWNVRPRAFVERMHREYVDFWNSARRHRADSLGLSPVQVSILASIVEEESNLAEEQRIIASVYLNRLRISMPLQACPTLKFALGDFSIRRVSHADTQVDSPYNTYKNPGLPPSPIRIPSKKAIDAVLDAADTDFLYMCARPDGSGRHSFARTLAQHQRNASEYHRSLNQRKIYR